MTSLRRQQETELGTVGQFNPANRDNPRFKVPIAPIANASTEGVYDRTQATAILNPEDLLTLSEQSNNSGATIAAVLRGLTRG
jgi:hypothetical protein